MLGRTQAQYGMRPHPSRKNRTRREAAYRFMSATAGDRSGFEHQRQVRISRSPSIRNPLRRLKKAMPRSEVLIGAWLIETSTSER